jgi:hypothetical protein
VAAGQAGTDVVRRRRRRSRACSQQSAVSRSVSRSVCRRALAIFATLTIDERVGQLLVPIIFPTGPHDLQVTAELRALRVEGGIGGYVITSASRDASQVRAFIDQLKAAARLPLLRCKLDWLGPELARDTASVGGEDVA